MARQSELDVLVKKEWPQDYEEPRQERPKSNIEDNAIIDKMLGAANGEKVLALMNGDFSAYPSQSKLTRPLSTT